MTQISTNIRQFSQKFYSSHFARFGSICLSFALILSHQCALAQDRTAVDSFFRDYNQANTPGIAVSVIKDDQVVYQKGFGMGNLEYSIPITETTKFHVASLSKQFTAFMILKLEDEGILSIKDDVRKYIPELPDYGSTITLHHLLTHSSGIREQWRLLELAGWRLDDVIKTEQIFKLIVNQKELNFSPGEQNMYSNSGYTLLAIVIERLTKISFAKYAKQTIFDPLQMHDSFFYDDHEGLVQNRAYSYKNENDQLKKSNLNFATVGPTSLFTTIEDMNKWALNFNIMTIGNKSIFKSMKKRASRKTNYAKGQFVRDYNGFEMVYHSGSDAGYRCYFARFPELGYQFILFANANYISAQDEVFKLMDYYLQDLYPKKKQNKDAEPDVFEYDDDLFIGLSNAEMKQFEGVYFDNELPDKITVKLVGDTLYCSGGGFSEAQKLYAVGKSNFKIVGTPYDVSVNFKENDFNEPILELRVPDYMWLWMEKVSKVDAGDHVGTYYSHELKNEYELIERGEELYLTHPQLDDIKVNPITDALFSSTNRNFSKIRFKRDDSGKITSFSVSNESIKGIEFSRK